MRGVEISLMLLSILCLLVFPYILVFLCNVRFVKTGRAGLSIEKYLLFDYRMSNGSEHYALIVGYNRNQKSSDTEVSGYLTNLTSYDK